MLAIIFLKGSMEMQTYWSNEAIKIYLLARVEQVPSGCWIWKLGLDRRGYGLCQVNGRRERAARLSFMIFVGPIPPGYDVHHTCFNRNCICPEHLEALPHGRHMRLHSQSGAWAGEKNGRAKLTEIDAQFIEVAGDLISAQALADQFGVSQRTIYNILSGDGWRHVRLPEPPERSLPEIIQDCQATAKRTLDVLLNLQELRRERRQAQPPDLEECIYFAKICAAL
jgi:hypothetical protein